MTDMTDDEAMEMAEAFDALGELRRRLKTTLVSMGPARLTAAFAPALSRQLEELAPSASGVLDLDAAFIKVDENVAFRSFRYFASTSSYHMNAQLVVTPSDGDSVAIAIRVHASIERDVVVHSILAIPPAEPAPSTAG